MTAPLDPYSRRLSFRTLGNIVGAIAVLAALDWSWSWFGDTPPYTCRAAEWLGAEGALALFGMGGLVIAIVGLTLGGVRHPMSVIGLSILTFGLLGGALIGAALPNLCAP